MTDATPTRTLAAVKGDVYLRPRPDLAVRSVDGEFVLLDRKSGAVHHLNLTASFVWSQLDGRTTTTQVAERVAESFHVEPATAVQDVSRLVEQFRGLALLLDPLPDGVEEHA